MRKTILRELLEHKGEPCISIIASVSLNSFDDIKKAQLDFKKLLEKAGEELKDTFDMDTASALTDRVVDLAGEVKFDRKSNGIGLYVSEEFQKLVYFPFKVNTRVVAGTSYEVGDLVANLQRLMAYKVLMLSKSGCRLFQFERGEFEEIKDDTFPKEYTDDYQREKAHPGSFYNDEESRVDLVRLENYFREVYQGVKGYIDDAPFVLMGIDKYLGTFKKVAENANVFVAEVKGNYDKHPIEKIRDMAQEAMDNYMQDKDKELIEKALNALHEQGAVSGIEESYQLVNQGAGRLLVVERDLAEEAYDLKPVSSIEAERNGRRVEVLDAVENTITKLLSQKNTEVHFVPKDTLKDYGRVILFTRY